VIRWANRGSLSVPLDPPRSSKSAQLLLLLLPDEEDDGGHHRQQGHGGEQQKGNGSPVGVHPQRKRTRPSSQESVAERLLALHLIEIARLWASSAALIQAPVSAPFGITGPVLVAPCALAEESGSGCL